MSCFEVPKPLRNACCLPELKRLNSSTWVNLSPWPDQKLCECFESLGGNGNTGKNESAIQCSTNDFYSRQASNREKGLTKAWRRLGLIYQSLVFPFDLAVAIALFRYGHLTQLLRFMRLKGNNESFLASTSKFLIPREGHGHTFWWKEDPQKPCQDLGCLSPWPCNAHLTGLWQAKWRHERPSNKRPNPVATFVPQCTSSFILEPAEQPIKKSSSWLTLINSHSIVAHVSTPTQTISCACNVVTQRELAVWGKATATSDSDGLQARARILTRHLASLGRGLVANAEPHSLPKGMGINGNQ